MPVVSMDVMFPQELNKRAPFLTDIKLTVEETVCTSSICELL